MADETPADSTPEVLREEDAGFNKALRPRQIQMVAIGGAIGTGLFMARAVAWPPPGPPWCWCTRSAPSSRSW